MSDEVAEGWAAEIRRFQLARLSWLRSVADGVSGDPSLPMWRARAWWILEGKRYDWIDSSLDRAWPELARHAERLLTSYNPVWREVDAPEGETDWVASGFASLSRARPAFVSRASASGLHAGERAALLGWAGWIRTLWSEFTAVLGTREGARGEPFEPPRAMPDPDSRAMRRWAHAAKRSRWPLLRSVVAESLRAATEPVRIDRLPLPTDRAILLELVSLVKVVDHLAPSEAALRWLDLDAGSNTVRVRGLTYRFQEPLSREEVLDTQEYDHGLRETLSTVTSRLPKYIDGWLRFDAPRSGFDGILVEAKSGSQGLDAALYQLKVYRAALRARGVGRLLVLGVIESLDDEVVEPASTEAEGDVWVFTGPGGIARAVGRWLG
jgi:hypothetical protein